MGVHKYRDLGLQVGGWTQAWQLTDGGKVVSPTHRSRSTPQKHFSASDTHFLLGAE
jgi:hypothetical protein